MKHKKQIILSPRESKIKKQYSNPKKQQQLLTDALLLHQQGELQRSLANVCIFNQAVKLNNHTLNEFNIDLLIEEKLKN